MNINEPIESNHVESATPVGILAPINKLFYNIQISVFTVWIAGLGLYGALLLKLE